MYCDSSVLVSVDITSISRPSLSSYLTYPSIIKKLKSNKLNRNEMNVGQKEMNYFEVVYGSKMCSEVPFKKYFMTINLPLPRLVYAAIAYFYSMHFRGKKIIHFSQYNQCQNFKHFELKITNIL